VCVFVCVCLCVCVCVFLCVCVCVCVWCVYVPRIVAPKTKLVRADFDSGRVTHCYFRLANYVKATR